MPEGYYATGTAAKALGLSSYHVRRLCETGLIRAELTGGDHWRIPVSEVVRIKREGIPPIPQRLPQEPANGAAKPSKMETEPGGLCAPPSDQVILSAEEVTITENRLRKRRIELEAEELEDLFRERERRQTDEAITERQTAAEVSAHARRQQWEDHWITYALSSVPKDASGIKLDVHQFVQEALAKLGPDRPNTVVRQIVDAAVARSLAPLRRTQDVERILNQAVEHLPALAKYTWGSKWKLRATEEAHRAVRQLDATASLAEVKAAASRAVARVTREFEHGQRCSSIIESIPSSLVGASAQEMKDAAQAVVRTVAATPTDATLGELERVRDQTLKPIKDLITRRQHQTVCEEAIRFASWKFPFGMDDELKKQATDAMKIAMGKLPVGTLRNEIMKDAELALQPFLSTHQMAEKKRRLIAEGLGEIHPYLLALSEEWELQKPLWNLAQKLKDGVREELQEQLNGDETLDEVKGLVRRLVEEELDLQGP